MKVLVFGASGMVGRGVLRECVLAENVSEVVAVLREPMRELSSPKLQQIMRTEFFDWTEIPPEFNGVDACFFCLGVTAVGKTEAEYRRLTYDLTVAAAEAVQRAAPQAVFVYVSGAGTNAQSRQMWARVKGATENAVMAMRFRGVYCFRPGYIQPMHGLKSRIGWYNAGYAAVGWAYPVIRRMAPSVVTNTETVGRAMLRVARDGWPQHVLETRDINAAGNG